MNHYSIHHKSLSVAARMAALLVKQDWEGIEHEGIVWQRQYDASWKGYIWHNHRDHHVATIRGAIEEWTA